MRELILRFNSCQNIVEKEEVILGTGVEIVPIIQQAIMIHNLLDLLLVNLITSVNQKKKMELVNNLYTSSLFNRRPLCKICQKPIEENYIFDHYRKKHSKYMKEAPKMGKQLSKAGLGRGTRRRLIRQRLNVK